ncbi:hypothetical protein [Algoriphagus sp. PAP.12]|uniref:hypothetical protein n=1 Tax=Algoriphagus sp. PAP.12 TaxID=2996678 RepID=UPI00227AAF88|nr:hypothetical protein [Algoriphagus sp. PAP.12]
MKKLLFLVILLFPLSFGSQGQSVDPPEIGEYTVCRCHGDSCQGGNQISIRRACGRIQATESCSPGSDNC